MEKQGVIKDGVTPPEGDDGVKRAAKPTLAQLEQDPTRRLADQVVDQMDSTAETDNG